MEKETFEEKKDNEYDAYEKKIKAFYFASDEEHIDAEKLMNGLSHRSIKKWAYILHDKDNYTNEDYEKYKQKNNEEPIWKIGDKKPNHYHVVCHIPNSEKINVIAKWFKLTPNQICIGKGKNHNVAFIECVEYLTHEREKEQQKGKYLYSDEEVVSNFDFRKEIDDFRKYNSVLTKKDLMLFQVLNEGKTINECKRQDIVLYSEIWEKIEKSRRQYLLANQVPPTTRINFYISGEGGTGKSLISRALARLLFPNIKNEEDIYFEVGGDGKVAFDGYDGQPVIIWNDVRSIDILRCLGNRGNVFNVFDTHPSPLPTRQNIKYGSIKLCNCVNIVNSVEDYTTFLNGLAGEYIKDGQVIKAEDKKQSYRRFPMILPLHKEDFDLLINKGFMNDTDDFFQYEEYLHIRGNMQKIANMCSRNQELLREVEKKTLSLPIQKYNELKDKKPIEVSKEELLEIFKNYGTQDLSKLEGDPFADFNESTKLESEDINLALNEVKKSEDESDAFDDIPDFE